MRHLILAIGLLASHPGHATQVDDLNRTVEPYLELASYTSSLSHLFELQCPGIGGSEFTCTGQRITVMAFPGGHCKVYSVPREFRFRKTGANRWSDYYPGDPSTETYEISKVRPLEWQLVYRAEMTRELKDEQEREMYSTHVAKLLMAPFVARQISKGASATMDCKRIEFVTNP